jgi:hypothetical protein
VAKPGAVLAAWGYKWPNVSPEINSVIRRFAAEVLRGYWPPQTRLALAEYQTIPFPFDPISMPPFQFTEEWNQHQLVGFVGTWSGSLRYRAKTGRDPTDELRANLEAAWGDPEGVRQVTWQVFTKVGRIHAG